MKVIATVHENLDPTVAANLTRSVCSVVDTVVDDYDVVIADAGLRHLRDADLNQPRWRQA